MKRTATQKVSKSKRGYESYLCLPSIVRLFVRSRIVYSNDLPLCTARQMVVEVYMLYINVTEFKWDNTMNSVGVTDEKFFMFAANAFAQSFFNLSESQIR